MFDIIDYVVYVQSDFLLCAFEAYFPKNIKHIDYISLLSSKQDSQQSTTSNISPNSSSGNLSIVNQDPQVIMKYIRNENRIAIFSKNGLVYTYYHPKLNIIPLTLS